MGFDFSDFSFVPSLFFKPVELVVSILEYVLLLDPRAPRAHEVQMRYKIKCCCSFFTGLITKYNTLKSFEMEQGNTSYGLLSLIP